MRLRIEGGTLHVELSWWEKVLSVRGSLRVPLESVERARPGRPPWTWRQLRIPGAHLPGIIKAGSYYTDRGWEFWFATLGKPYLTVELRSGRYRRLVLGVTENEAWVKRINRAVGAKG